MSSDSLPFSQACENNKGPILEVIRTPFKGAKVLEVGSGTAQHAVHFASNIDNVTWQCTDQSDYLSGIQARLSTAKLNNTPPPIEFDVLSAWPAIECDAVFSANTLHIMAWPMVEAFFAHLGRELPEGGLVAIYGPFNYNGQFTSPSNQRFDESLRARDPAMGIRDVEAVQDLAKTAGLALISDNAMPANNRLLLWERR